MKDIAWVRELIRRAQVSQRPAVRGAYGLVRRIYRFVGRTVWILGLGWVDSIRRITRSADGWLIEGWGYHRGTDFGPEPQFRAWLVRRGRKIELAARTIYDVEARAAARAAEYDYALDSFEIDLPDAVIDALSTNTRWRLRVEIKGNGHRVRGWVRRFSRVGSALAVGVERRADGRLAGPFLDDEQGTVRFGTWHPPVLATAVEFAGSSVSIEVSGPVDKARWIGRDQQPHPLDQVSSGAGTTLVGELPAWVTAERDVSGTRSEWGVEIWSGRTWTPLVASGELASSGGSNGVAARTNPAGELRIVQVPVMVIVESVEVIEGDPTRVSLSGRFDGPREFTLAFRSRFETIPVVATIGEDGRFTGEAVLSISRWNGPAMPPPLGVFALVVGFKSAVHSTFIEREVGDLFPQMHTTDDYRLRVSAAQRDQLALRFGPPRTDAEFGAWRQLQLRERFTTGDIEPLDAVYLESFFGRNATCNPMAIDAELAQSHPELPRYWGVQDRSVVVPSGAIPLVRGTEDWWRVRSSARWVVTNEWLRANFVKQPFQTVMQTWHGSMFKQIGLDRGARGKAHLKVVEQERARWDLFVSQAPETTPIIKGAYALDNQVVEIGYPRNDELRAFSDDDRRDLRERIGLPHDTTIVMYAPTWREAGQEDVELLNLESLGSILGTRFTFLRRGHVRSLGNSSAARAANVLDVSTYPQINDLLGVADVLITDYSSMMFDFSVTGRPMIFYTPDIDDYTDDKVRGSYFDLEERAPGPVTREVGDVVRLLRTLDTWPAEFAGRYRAWEQRYNVLDDGHASRRAVEALLQFRPVTRDRPIEVDVDAVFGSDTEGPASESETLDIDAAAEDSASS